MVYFKSDYKIGSYTKFETYTLTVLQKNAQHLCFGYLHSLVQFVRMHYTVAKASILQSTEVEDRAHLTNEGGMFP